MDGATATPGLLYAGSYENLQRHRARIAAAKGLRKAERAKIRIAPLHDDDMYLTIKLPVSSS